MYRQVGEETELSSYLPIKEACMGMIIICLSYAIDLNYMYVGSILR